MSHLGQEIQEWTQTAEGLTKEIRRLVGSRLFGHDDQVIRIGPTPSTHRDESAFRSYRYGRSVVGRNRINRPRGERSMGSQRMVGTLDPARSTEPSIFKRDDKQGFGVQQFLELTGRVTDHHIRGNVLPEIREE